MITIKLIGGAKKSFNSDELKIDKSDISVSELLELLSMMKPKDTSKIDVENIINEKLYYTLSDVIKEYECCSYFKKNNKEILFPYTEVSINIIFYLITIFAGLQKKIIP